ncbi:unnamed protein product, partial [Polarella glacialis]
VAAPQSPVAKPSRTLVHTASSPSAPPPVSSPAPSVASSPAGTRGKHMKLMVSEAAQEEDKALRGVSEKKKAMEESRRQMLEKLTKQIQMCLTRVQSGDLDEEAKEKYQDMMSSLKAQMAKISHF